MGGRRKIPFSVDYNTARNIAHRSYNSGRAVGRFQGLAGAGAIAAGKYAYDKFLKKPVSVVKAAAGAGRNTTRAMKNRTVSRRPRLRLRALPKGDEGTGGYNQWSQRYHQATLGKLTPRKIDRLSLSRLVLTHRRIGPFNDNGQLYLENKLFSNGNLRFPLVLFELNSTNNVINGSVQNHAPVKMLHQSASPSQLYWEDIQGQATDGSLSAAWQIENSEFGSSAGNTFPHDNAIHKWSSLDLELWGCKNKPTKYTIELVQFNEDVLPDWAARTGQSAEFWQSMVKHYTYSPLAKMEDGYNRAKYKVLKRYKVNIDPTANYENDSDPHVRTLKLYYKMNRHCNFAWQFSNPAIQSATDMNDVDWKQEANQASTQVHPNARIYVMIRASNYTQISPTGTTDNTTNPSISWRMRTCYMYSH